MTLTHDESIALAESLLLHAGWRPHVEWGRFTNQTLVAGWTPDGQSFHVKDWAKIPPGHPLHSVDTPDEPHEAAAWLIAKFSDMRASNATSGEASQEAINRPPDLGDGANAAVAGASILDGVPESVAGPGTNSAPRGENVYSDAGLGGADNIDAGSERDDDAVTAEIAELLGGGDVQNDPAPAVWVEADSGDSGPADLADAAEGANAIERAFADDPDSDGFIHDIPEPSVTDAEFSATVIVEGADVDPHLLPEPDPEDFAPEPTAEDEASVAYFGDDLDTMRRIKAGDVAIHAAELIAGIDAAYSEQPNEFAEVQSYVMANVDKGTGLFTGDRRDLWDRFVDLSAARDLRSAIARHRDIMTELLMTRERDWVVACDPKGGWPV